MMMTAHQGRSADPRPNEEQENTKESTQKTIYKSVSVPMVTRGPGGDFTQIQATSKRYYLWSEVWCSMSKVAQKKKKQQWAV